MVFSLTNLKKACSTLLTIVYEVDCNFSVLTYKTILSSINRAVLNEKNMEIIPVLNRDVFVLTEI